MRQAIQHLRAEHDRLIEIIQDAETVADRVLHGEHVDAAVVRHLTEFFMLYVHGIHREKEEDVLFPLLKGKGMHHPGGCVGVMLAEHDDGQNAFLTMERAAELYENGSDEAAPAWSRAALIYCHQLRIHLRRESDVVFPAAERALTSEDDLELTTHFTRIDERAKRSGIVERLEAAEQGARRASA
jgi:hemerythrin-like domain-containing protein